MSRPRFCLPRQVAALVHSQGSVKTVLALLLALMFVGPVARADDALEQQRTALFRDGTALAQHGDWQGAAAKFRRVVELRSAPRALIALALAEEHLGHLTTAKHLYEKAVADARTQSLTEDEKDASDKLGQLAPRVPRITIKLANHARALAVTVDGAQAVGRGGEYDVDPGEHNIVVQGESGQQYRQVVTLQEKDRVEVAAVFAREGATTAPSNAPSSEGGGAPIGPIVLGAAGIATAGVGMLLWALGENQQSNVERQCGGTTTCPISLQSKVQSDIDGSRSQIFVGDALVGLGAAAVLGGALWWVLEDREGGRTSQTTGLMFAPQSGGALIGWHGPMPF